MSGSHSDLKVHRTIFFNQKFSDPHLFFLEKIGSKIDFNFFYLFFRLAKTSKFGLDDAAAFLLQSH